VIDSNRRAFDRLAVISRGEMVLGNGIDEDVLRQAGIESADGFASLTNGTIATSWRPRSPPRSSRLSGLSPGSTIRLREDVTGNSASTRSADVIGGSADPYHAERMTELCM